MTGRPLRIAMLSIHSSPLGPVGTRETGGMSVYIRELARHLGARGHQIDVFTAYRNGPQAPAAVLAPNVRLIHLPAPPAAGADPDKLVWYRHLPDLFEALERFRVAEALNYDLIHSHYWLSGHLGTRLQERWRRPHLLMYHSLGAMKNRAGAEPPEPPLRLAVEADLGRSADRVLAPTQREKLHIIEQCGAAPERIGVVPCGVDAELFRPFAREAARRHLGLDPLERLALYVGRFEPAKGLDLLLQALALCGRQRQIRLLVVGGDDPGSPAAEAVKQNAAALGVNQWVRFLGRMEQERLPLYYSAADFLVVPSRYESFGLVALEALACGCPVLATPVGVMPELLEDTRFGRLVERASAEALAAGLRVLGNGFSRPAAVETRAAVAGFNWSAVASAVLAEYALLPRRCADRRHRIGNSPPRTPQPSPEAK